MALTAGSRLGPYEILTPLGAGGMGEVYRARDTRLGRDVAVKVLADALAKDPDHLARFEREARVLASLEHPNIDVIHGLEEAEGMRFLVLELVEGKSLAGKLAAGPIPADEALRLAAQIAAALEAAHEKGVIHRDLKPANVQVTPAGRVKVLDFGLAKSLEGRADDLSAAATITAAATTQDGTVLGTPAYMSPEQARGRPVDKRTDLWSFGCVLYEMLSGRRAFEGATAPDTLVAVLSREPDLSALPRGTPDAIRHLLARCLEKDPERRMRDAGDARLEVESALGPDRAAAPRGLSRWIVPAIAAALLAAVVFLLLRGRGSGSAGAHRAARLVQVTLAEGIEQFPAFSPEGGRLAYAGESRGVRKIMIRTLSTGEDRRATSGDTDDIQPAWSPDGKTILFVRSRETGKRLEPGDVFGWYVGGDVWSLDVASGRESLLVENAFNPAFSPDGSRVAVDASWAGGHRIWIVTASGSNPQQVTSDVSEAIAHIGPRWSPDGGKIVFQTFERTRFEVRVVDVASQRIVATTNDLFRDLNPVWAPSGRAILFTSDRGGGLNVWRIPVRPDGSPSGPPEQLTTGAGQDVELAVSPDGKRLAFAILKQNADLWKLPVSPQTGLAAGEPLEVLGTTREDSRGAWSPDGRRIAFNSDRAGDMNLWIASLPDGAVRQLTRGAGGDYQPNWSPDGRSLVFFSARAGNQDIWSADVSSGSLRRLTKTPSIDVNPFYSPDGSRIAYMSDGSGRLEVWVMGADGTSPAPLTRTGVTGHFLRWTRDGRSVLYRCPCGGSPRTLDAALSGGEPATVGEVAGGAHMSLSPDGSRIMDVVAHKVLWVSTLTPTGKPEKVFEFPDPDSRIDYPVWSPDGRAVLFDRFRPQGGDIWMLEGIE